MAYQFAKLNKGSTAVFSSGGYSFFKMSKGGGGSGAVAFATDDWSIVQAEAQRIALAGSADDSPYNVGDTRTITLFTNERVQIAIMGFNHDDLTTAYANGATKAGITVGMADCLATTAMMKSTATNVGGWGSSAMRTSMATYLSQLPSALQAVVSPANKLTSAGGGSSTIVTTSDSLWLFSLEEVNGTIYRDSGNASQRTFAGEGTQYAYFSQAQIPSGFSPMITGATAGTFIGNGSSYTTRLNTSQSTSSPRLYNRNSYKGLGVAPASSFGWWVRSPYANATSFVFVSNSSLASYNAAQSIYGVSFGFCI